jgi:predicted transcriptional regulator of viral defense system
MGDTVTESDFDPHSKLFELASSQGGYFTSEQAGQAGLSKALLAHHAKRGKFIRIRRGLYRFRDYPSSPREDVAAAWLAIGGDAIVSHESALELLELSDVIPSAIHLTVPRTKRNLPKILGVRFHTTSRPLATSDRTVRDGVPVTSPVRTILDASAAGTAPDQIELAIRQALQLGQLTSRQLLDQASKRSKRVSNLIRHALQRVMP